MDTSLVRNESGYEEFEYPHRVDSHVCTEEHRLTKNWPKQTGKRPCRFYSKDSGGFFLTVNLFSTYFSMVDGLWDMESQET